MSRDLALLGRTLPRPDPLHLAAGALSCVFEDGALRYLRWRGIEMLRGVGFLARDRDWGTPDASPRDLAVESDAHRFRIEFATEIASGAIRFRTRARILGEAAGRLSFEVDGEALAEFETNRCGFVVLHPANVAGLALTVTHTSGAREETRFPVAISPGQPVFDIRALGYERQPGLRVDCRLDAAPAAHDPAGKFEMEDQRNWCDASFKTYSGSLLDPWPFRIAPGRSVAQSVTVTIDDRARTRTARPSRDSATAIAVGDPTGQRMPEIGLGWPMDDRSIDAVAGPIARLRPRHIVVSIDLGRSGLAARLGRAAAFAARCGSAVQLELVLPCVVPLGDEVAAAAALCREAGLRPAAVLAVPRAYLKSHQPTGVWPDVPALDDIYAACRAAFPAARIGGGVHTYFTELNRKRPSGRGIDFVSYTTAAIVHAADDDAVMETLTTLPAMSETARALWPDLVKRIGPSSIAMRYNPYGADTLPNVDEGRVAMAARDPRQRGLFAAAWTVGYAAAVAPAGLETLALHAVAGPSGLAVEPDDVPAEWRAANPAAVVHPVYHVMRLLAAAGGAACLECRSGDEAIAALAWRGSQGTRLAIANLSPAPAVARLDRAARVAILDVASCAAAGSDPGWIDRAPIRTTSTFDLDSYAVAIADVGSLV